MFNVTVNFGRGQWQFLFKDQKDAYKVRDDFDAALNTAPQPPLRIADDFGTCATIMTGDVVGVIIEDMVTSGEAAIERSMVQARSQARFQSKAQGDAVIRMAQPTQIARPANGPFMRS